MKSLAIVSSLAALVAFVFVQFTFIAAVSLLFSAGLLAILAYDYALLARNRTRMRLRQPAALTHRERLGLAA